MRKYVRMSLAAAAALGIFGGAGSALAQAQSSGDAFHWKGRIDPAQWLRVRDMNGDISAQPADGNELEVTATKKWRRSDPKSVEVRVVPHDGTVTLCALWEGKGSCDAGGNYEHHGVRNNDVSVHFELKIPRGVRLDASTVNGSVRVTRVDAALRAHTVNGALEVDTSGGPVEAETTNGSVRVQAHAGPVQAHTTNGSITAKIDQLPSGGDLEFSTVNGSITCALPTTLSADVDASVVNGSVTTDFPVTVQGQVSKRHLQGRIGAGGRRLHASTVNGSVHLTK